MSDGDDNAAAFATQLERLRAAYLGRLPGELGELCSLLRGAPGGEPARPLLADVHRRLHKLTGSGGTFGLAELSGAARVLEQRVKGWLEQPLDGLEPQALAQLADQVATLVHSPVAAADQRTPVPVPATRAAARPTGNASVWLATEDPLLGDELTRQLESFSYNVVRFAALAEAEAHAVAAAAHPDILIIDTLFDDGRQDATLSLRDRPALAELPCPLLFLSARDDFGARIRAARLGAAGYFLKPLDTPRLVSAMERVIGKRHAAPQRVLIVDDDETLASHYQLVLQAAGMEVAVLESPPAIMETVAHFRPEMVLLDLHMPEYAGPDLAAVIRQHDSWSSLPIVYLSAELDLEVQTRAMDRGADDFLTKPVSDAQLVAAVRARVERARQMEAQINRDSLTGLLKHGGIKEAAHIELERARRTGKPVTLAMLDIDYFKQVNDTYGHAVGDLVISSVATLLRQRLRQSDVVGRYGGEEFVVVLPECGGDDAQLLLDDIRERFGRLRFNHRGAEFSCTLSAGHASAQGLAALDAETLLCRADEALYAAKRGGRNRVCS